MGTRVRRTGESRGNSPIKALMAGIRAIGGPVRWPPVSLTGSKVRPVFRVPLHGETTVRKTEHAGQGALGV